MEITEIKARYEKALKVFLDEEIYLLENDVSERAMAHKLAEYLSDQFPDFDVDCEYNRNGKKPKYVQVNFNEALTSEVEKLVVKAIKWREILKKGENEYMDNDIPPITFSTFPDIIIHQRGENYPTNILVIEIKKDGTDDEDVIFDYAKLKDFTSKEEGNEYRYKVGVHLTLSSEKGDSVYFRNGSIEKG